jgi:hypothetical protein
VSYSSEVLADSPVGYWRLDETSGTNAADSSGNSHSGTYNGSPTLNQASLLVSDANASVNFDGVDDYINLSNPSALRLTSAFTLEAWARIPSGETSEAAVIAGSYDGSRVNYTLAFFDGSASSLKPAVGFYNGSWHMCQSADSLTLDAAHHIVGTWDGTDLKIYVDNVLKNTVTPGSSPTTGTSDYYIGSRWDNAASPQKFKGRIDEVAIYGTNIGATRIAAHYTAGIAVNGTATPSATAGIGAVPAPTAQVNGTAVPSTTVGTGAVPAVSGLGNATALPSATVGTGAVPAAAAQGAATATPSATAGIGLVPVATAFSGTAGNAAPSTVVGTGLVPAPTATGVVNGTGTPTATVGIGAVPAPTVSGRATGLPSATAGIGAAPSPTAKGNSSTVPARVVGVAAVSAAVVTGGGAGRPSAVVGTARVPHVHALGQGTGGGGGSPNGATDFWAIKLGV